VLLGAALLGAGGVEFLGRLGLLETVASMSMTSARWMRRSTRVTTQAAWGKTSLHERGAYVFGASAGLYVPFIDLN
jgi:hypothetical protein